MTNAKKNSATVAAPAKSVVTTSKNAPAAKKTTKPGKHQDPAVAAVIDYLAGGEEWTISGEEDVETIVEIVREADKYAWCKCGTVVAEMRGDVISAMTTIDRLTSTQIILRNGGRYNRHNFTEIGGNPHRKRVLAPFIRTDNGTE